MSKVSKLQQTKFDKDLKVFIDNLSKIEIDYKKIDKNDIEKLKSKDKTILFFAIIFLNFFEDINLKKMTISTGLTAKTINYLISNRLSQQFLEFEQLIDNYDNWLDESKNETTGTELTQYLKNGFDYIINNYVSNPDLYKEMLDFNALNYNEGIESIINQLDSINETVEKLAEVYDKNSNKWKKIKNIDLNKLAIMFESLLNEFYSLNDILQFLTVLGNAKEISAQKTLKFIESKNLSDEYEEFLSNLCDDKEDED
ncbi:MAG TPA: hypothetical protein P5556_07025 [Candidatus Gastranaerophilales bacterium]|nr:hypothetical protein [Candidatus Gastranaerophilales bacterium]